MQIEIGSPEAESQYLVDGNIDIFIESGIFTPSSHRFHLHRCHRHPRLSLRLLLPHLALVEGGHRQPTADQWIVNRDILNVLCSCPNGTLRICGKHRNHDAVVQLA
jgi:hypothetical protein